MTPEFQHLAFASAVPLEAKATPQGLLEGLASPFGGEPDVYGDVVAAGAFAASLGRHKREKTAPALLWAHDARRIAGKWLDVVETTSGLEVRGQLNLGTMEGREAFEHVRAGDLDGLSIGYVAKKARHEKGARILAEVDLMEVSLVAVPAARSARIRSVKSAPPMFGSRAELRDWLAEAGMARAAAEKVATAGWPALSAKNHDHEDVAAFAAAIKAATLKLRTL